MSDFPKPDVPAGLTRENLSKALDRHPSSVGAISVEDKRVLGILNVKIDNTIAAKKHRSKLAKIAALARHQK